MPTYDGTTIVTGTLYEDGTILIKNSFGKGREVESATASIRIDSGRKKEKMLSSVQLPKPAADTSTNCSIVINSGRKNDAILVQTQQQDIDTNVSIVINSVTKRTAIIVG